MHLKIRHIYGDRNACADDLSCLVGPGQREDEEEESSIKRFLGIDLWELFHRGNRAIVPCDETNIGPSLSAIKAILQSGNKTEIPIRLRRQAK